MAASNLFNSVDESIVSSASGICNTGISINDSSNSSVYAPSGQPVSSSNSSDRQSNELIDLNEANNLEVSLNLKNSQLNRLAVQGSPAHRHLTSLAADPASQAAIDIALQNYLLDYKSFADDTKSMTSVMTSKSTRETFECLSRVLPVGILLLIVFIMIHFVLYVRDIEPYQSITEVICIALAICVFTLSSAFIVKIFCDSKDRSQWTNSSYGEEEYVYSPNNHYFYTGSSEPALASSNLPSHLINSGLNASKPSTNFQTGGADYAADGVIRKQPHYYIDTGGNRIYAAQMAGLEYKNNKRYDLPGYYPTSAASPNYSGTRAEQSNQFGQSQFNPSQCGSNQFNQNQLNQSHFSQSQLGQSQLGQSQLGQSQLGQSQFSQSQFGQIHLNQSQLGQNQFGQPSPPFKRRTSASEFDPRNPSKLSGMDKKVEQCIQTINLVEARRKEAISLVKETAT